MLTAHCPACRHAYDVPGSLVGQATICPECGERFRVRGPAAPAKPKPRAEPEGEEDCLVPRRPALRRRRMAAAVVAILVFSSAAILAWHFWLSPARRSMRQGDVAYDRGDLELAISCYSDVLRRDPDNSRAYLHRAEAHNQRREYEQAVKDCTEAIRLAPSARGYASRGAARIGQRDFSGALGDLDIAVKMDPSDAYARYDHGRANSLLHLDDLAVHDLTEAIRLKPDLPHVYTLRAASYIELKNYQAAIADANVAIAGGPEAGAGYLMRGRANWALGRKEEARRDFRAARAADSSLGSIIDLAEEMDRLDKLLQDWSR